eukprot:3869799-Pleurochrysis_carterae.AAC.2
MSVRRRAERAALSCRAAHTLADARAPLQGSVGLAPIVFCLYRCGERSLLVASRTQVVDAHAGRRNTYCHSTEHQHRHLQMLYATSRRVEQRRLDKVSAKRLRRSLSARVRACQTRTPSSYARSSGGTARTESLARDPAAEDGREAWGHTQSAVHNTHALGGRRGGGGGGGARGQQGREEGGQGQVAQQGIHRRGPRRVSRIVQVSPSGRVKQDTNSRRWVGVQEGQRE